MPKLRVLSLGWGVQSFTLAATPSRCPSGMAALGELEPLDFALHADTLNERRETYDFAREWTPWLEERGVRVVTVPAAGRVLDRAGALYIPAFTKDSGGKKGGQLRRQCTHRWKIIPMRKMITQEIRRRKLKKRPGEVELWLGISLDEFQRMKDSDAKYLQHRWPLIDKRMTRDDCHAWLRAKGLPSPVKSACVFCPYHNKAGWREIKNGPDWSKAVEVDQAIRTSRPPFDVFVHAARQPLDQVDLSTPEERGQLNLWNEECSGVCGV